MKKVDVHGVQQLLYLFLIHPSFTYSMWEFWEKSVLKMCFLSACLIDCKKKKKKKCCPVTSFFSNFSLYNNSALTLLFYNI